MDETLSMLEGSSEIPPAVFQSAADYGEETVELETACRLLKNKCTFEMHSTIAAHKRIIEAAKARLLMR
jgi:hypothetical protein